MLTIFLLIACIPETNSLSDSARLRRLSIDLRGYPPTLEEIHQLQNATKGLNNSERVIQDLTLSMVESSAFPKQMGHFWAKIYQTRQDETLYSAEDLGMENPFRFAYAVGDEPIQIVQEVIAENLPWYQVVTADWTMVNEDLFQLYPVVLDEPHSFEEVPWQRAHYLDGRPNAGILSSNGFWWRYETSSNNASRARANQISRIFLCHDYLHQNVQFNTDLDLTASIAQSQAVKTESECLSCHASLDPLASFLGGVFVPRKSPFEEMRIYHPERENIWTLQTGIAPSYFGETGSHLGDLGRLIAQDESFLQCTIEHTWNFLFQREVAPQHFEKIQEFRDAFVEGGWDYTSLILAMVNSSEYQNAQPKILNPEQLAQSIDALTGFEMISDSYSLLYSSQHGFYEMLGGAQMMDKNLSISMVLIQQQFAQMATDFWFSELGKPLPIDTSTLGEQDFQVENLQILHQVILSVSPSEAELKELLDYISLLQEHYEPEEIWKSVIRILLQDPRFLLY